MDSHQQMHGRDRRVVRIPKGRPRKPVSIPPPFRVEGPLWNQNFDIDPVSVQEIDAYSLQSEVLRKKFKETLDRIIQSPSRDIMQFEGMLGSRHSPFTRMRLRVKIKEAYRAKQWQFKLRFWMKMHASIDVVSDNDTLVLGNVAAAEFYMWGFDRMIELGASSRPSFTICSAFHKLYPDAFLMVRGFENLGTQEKQCSFENWIMIAKKYRYSLYWTHQDIDGDYRLKRGKIFLAFMNPDDWKRLNVEVLYQWNIKTLMLVPRRRLSQVFATTRGYLRGLVKLIGGHEYPYNEIPLSKFQDCNPIRPYMYSERVMLLRPRLADFSALHFKDALSFSSTHDALFEATELVGPGPKI